MFSFIAFAGVMYCLYRIGKLEETVELLKKRQQGTTLVTENNKTEVVPNFATVTPEPEPVSFAPEVVSPADEYMPAGNNILELFIQWVKKDFLVKLGAFLILIALGWFVSYAFANNWIGPIGRITIGLLIGAGFMVGGTLRAAYSRNQSGIFAVLGSATILLTVYAAREMYDLFTPVSALLIMFMSVVFIARMAVVYRMTNVAVSGLLLAAWAPFLTNSPEASVVTLFTYLAVIVLGSLWVLYLLEARVLLLLSLGIVFLYSLPYMMVSGSEAALALGFGFFFTAVFFLANIISFIRHPKSISIINYIVSVGTGLYLISWVASTSAFDESLQSLVYIAWSVVFAYGSFIVFRLFKDKKPFFSYSAVSVALLAAATATILEGEMLTIVFAIEVTTLVALAAKVLGDLRLAAHMTWLYSVPIMLSADSLSSWQWSNTILNDSSFVLLTLASCFGLAAYVLSDQLKEREDYVKQITTVVLSLLGIYVASWIWLATHAVLSYEGATMVSLFIYMVTGIAFYVEGITSTNKALRIAGWILIALVIARLLMVEVWQMEITGKIIIFTLIGAMLISTAFIKKLQKNNIE